MQKITKHLLLLAVDTTPLLYVLRHNHGKGLSLFEHGQRTPNHQHCFYRRHAGKILFGSLTLNVSCAVYIWKDWPVLGKINLLLE